MGDPFDVSIGSERFTGTVDDAHHGSGEHLHTHLGQALHFLSNRGTELQVALPMPYGTITLDHGEIERLREADNSDGPNGRVAVLAAMLRDRGPMSALSDTDRAGIATVILANIDQAFATRGADGLEARRRGGRGDVMLDLRRGGDDAASRLSVVDSPDTVARPDRPAEGAMRGTSLRRGRHAAGHHDASRHGARPEARPEPRPARRAPEAETPAVAAPADPVATRTAEDRAVCRELYDILHAAREGHLDETRASAFLAANNDAINRALENDALPADVRSSASHNRDELERRVRASREAAVDTANLHNWLERERADAPPPCASPIHIHAGRHSFTVDPGTRITNDPTFNALPDAEQLAVLRALRHGGHDRLRAQSVGRPAERIDVHMTGIGGPITSRSPSGSFTVTE